MLVEDLGDVSFHIDFYFPFVIEIKIYTKIILSKSIVRGYLTIEFLAKIFEDVFDVTGLERCD